MAGDDVDHATDRIGAVERRSLRSANYLDAIHRLRRELQDKQWISELDAIDVDLGITSAERAGAANAAVMSKQRCRGALPYPQSGHQIAQRLRQISLGVARKLGAAHYVHRDRQRARRTFDGVSGDDYAVEHPRHPLVSGAGSLRWHQHDVLSARCDRQHRRVAQQESERLSQRNRIERRAHLAVERKRFRCV